MSLLLENGDRLLLEDGGQLLLESSPVVGVKVILLESGDTLLLESGDRMLTEDSGIAPPSVPPTGFVVLLESGDYLLLESGDHLLTEAQAAATTTTGGKGDNSRREPREAYLPPLPRRETPRRDERHMIPLLICILETIEE